MTVFSTLATTTICRSLPTDPRMADETLPALFHRTTGAAALKAVRNGFVDAKVRLGGHLVRRRSVATPIRSSPSRAQTP